MSKQLSEKLHVISNKRATNLAQVDLYYAQASPLNLQASHSEAPSSSTDHPPSPNIYHEQYYN